MRDLTVFQNELNLNRKKNEVTNDETKLLNLLFDSFCNFLENLWIKIFLSEGKHLLLMYHNNYSHFVQVKSRL